MSLLSDSQIYKPLHINMITASSNITVIISVNVNNQTGVSFTNDIILQIHTFILKSPTTKMIPTLTHFGTTWDTKY
jgi:hypothetical protein